MNNTGTDQLKEQIRKLNRYSTNAMAVLFPDEKGVFVEIGAVLALISNVKSETVASIPGIAEEIHVCARNIPGCSPKTTLCDWCRKRYDYEEIDPQQREINQLREELKQVKKERDVFMDQLKNVAEPAWSITMNNIQLRKENQSLRSQLVAKDAGLAFYADEATYDIDHLDKHGYIIIDKDGGEQARTILALYATINESKEGADDPSPETLV